MINKWSSRLLNLGIMRIARIFIKGPKRAHYYDIIIMCTGGIRNTIDIYTAENMQNSIAARFTTLEYELVLSYLPKGFLYHDVLSKLQRNQYILTVGMQCLQQWNQNILHRMYPIHHRGISLVFHSHQSC